MPKDLGNWKYTLIYTLVSELARGTKHKRHGDFELLAATWPSMAIKWKPTKNSLVKKGDVLEVCIALCMACPTQSLAHRKKFLDVCAKLNHMLDCCAMRLFSGSGDPTLKTVPNPTNYGRFLLY